MVGLVVDDDQQNPCCIIVLLPGGTIEASATAYVIPILEILRSENLTSADGFSLVQDQKKKGSIK